jgi:hypothetical protein
MVRTGDAGVVAAADFSAVRGADFSAAMRGADFSAAGCGAARRPAADRVATEWTRGCDGRAAGTATSAGAAEEAGGAECPVCFVLQAARSKTNANPAPARHGRTTSCSDRERRADRPRDS